MSLANFRFLFTFFLIVILQASYPAGLFTLSSSLSLTLTVYHFAFLHESSPTTYFTLALSQSLSRYFGSVRLPFITNASSACTFTDTYTLIVPLHSLHFSTFALGQAGLHSSNVPKAFVSLETCSSFHSAYSNAIHTHKFELSLVFCSRNWCTCRYEPMTSCFLDERYSSFILPPHTLFCTP